MEIQGEEKQIDQVILAIERGTYVRIENMDVKTIPVVEHDHGFRTRWGMKNVANLFEFLNKPATPRKKFIQGTDLNNGWQKNSFYFSLDKILSPVQ